MHPEQREFLNLEQKPARLSAQQCAWLLGFQEHDIAPLLAAGLLHPLGRPGPNAPKYFAVAELEGCRLDRKWLARATDAIQAYWRTRNARRRCAGRKPVSFAIPHETVR